MNIKQRLIDFLISCKKQTVSLVELESIDAGFPLSYEDLSQVILGIEECNILQMVKTQGRNGKIPSLAYQYRINKHLLNNEFHRELQLAELRLDNQIKLSAYYSLPREVWIKDLPFIDKIDSYIKKRQLPDEPVPAPERSLELVGDEKWISEKEGESILNRLGLWEQMKIISVADPLMLAINPQSFKKGDNAVHHHLIVENKTTFQALLQTLLEVSFTSLIYGCGKKVVRNIELFSHQLPLQGTKHRFYYFGDIDHEGINIWHSLNDKVYQQYQEQVLPALPFYRACLQKAYVYGKHSHRKDEHALKTFLSYFDLQEKQTIQACLLDGGYYPQEILKTAELRQLWRSALWTL